MDMDYFFSLKNLLLTIAENAFKIEPPFLHLGFYG